MNGLLGSDRSARVELPRQILNREEVGDTKMEIHELVIEMKLLERRMTSMKKSTVF